VAADLGELAPAEFADERFLPDVREDSLVAHADARDPLMQRVLREVARVSFDFR